MDKAAILEKIKLIQASRPTLVRLLEQPNLGILRLDVNQALEELDELIAESQLTFPEEKL